jgi:hypothetical protein
MCLLYCDCLFPLQSTSNFFLLLLLTGMAKFSHHSLAGPSAIDRLYLKSENFNVTVKQNNLMFIISVRQVPPGSTLSYYVENNRILHLEGLGSVVFLLGTWLFFLFRGHLYHLLKAPFMYCFCSRSLLQDKVPESLQLSTGDRPQLDKIGVPLEDEHGKHSCPPKTCHESRPGRRKIWSNVRRRIPRGERRHTAEAQHGRNRTRELEKLLQRRRQAALTAHRARFRQPAKSLSAHADH